MRFEDWVAEVAAEFGAPPDEFLSDYEQVLRDMWKGRGTVVEAVAFLQANGVGGWYF